jgi:DNA-binding transcriptional ArsR family regulator
LSVENFEMYRMKAELCKAFSDPKRLMIVNVLGQGEITVNELSEIVGLQQPVVSRNLAILRHYGVVKTRREGTRIHYSLTDDKIIQACNLVHEILLGQMEGQKNKAEEMTTEE